MLFYKHIGTLHERKSHKCSLSLVAKEVFLVFVKVRLVLDQIRSY